MPESMADVYEQNLGEFESLKHLYAGVTLFSLGLLALLAGIVLSTTNILGTYGLNTWQHWELAGLAGGLGLPAAFIGVFAVLPSNTRRTRIAAVGSLLTVLGVAFFYVVFPDQWVGDAPSYAFPVAVVYASGALTTFWCMFSGIVDFKTRNDPGGTVTLKVTQQGETKYVEVDRSELHGMGGLGVIGNDPDGNVETQTNNPQKTQTQPQQDAIPADASHEWPEQGRR